MTTNQAIVAAARGWLGTRFHHQGRLRKTSAHKGGVDCLGLLVGIANELNIKTENGALLASLDRANYSHLPDVGELYSALCFGLTPKPLSEVEPGNILLFEIDGRPQHLAVVSNHDNGLGIIHAYAQARAVVEHALDEWWLARIKAAFCIQSI